MEKGYLVVRFKDEKIERAKVFIGADDKAFQAGEQMYQAELVKFNAEERTDPNVCKGQLIFRRVEIETC